MMKQVYIITEKLNGEVKFSTIVSRDRLQDVKNTAEINRAYPMSTLEISCRNKVLAMQYCENASWAH